MNAELDIAIAGGDTAQPLNLAKRVALVERLADSLIGKDLLDCGCGAGGYARAYAQLGAHVVGVEFSAAKLAQAHHDQPSSPADDDDDELPSFVRADLEHLPMPNQTFDIAVMNEVLEHVPSEQHALRELRRVLRPGGVLIIMSPNRLYPFESHGVSLKGRSQLLPVYLPLVPYLPVRIGRHVFDYWARNYWPWELQRIVRAAGFKIFETGFVAQTFENITGTQPAAIANARTTLRAIASTAERLPIARAFCSVSQLIAARVS